MEENKRALTPKNRTGRNQYTQSVWQDTPYSLKYIQAKTMLDAGKTYDQIRGATGLSSATIAKVSKGEIEISPSWLKPVKSVESAKLTALTHQILDSISPDDISKSSLLQRTTAAAQLIDKRRLIDGESTANILHADLVSTLADDRARLLHQLEQLK
jgi:hypothetical protein